MPKNDYAMCDFCHKAKPRQELEKITVTYRKCKECLVGALEGSENKIETKVEEKKSPRRRSPVPPSLKECFKPPDEFGKQPDSGAEVLKKEEIKEEKKDDGNNKPSAV